MATDAEDVKRQLEAIAGRELQVEPGLVKFLWFAAGAYDYADGQVVWQSVVLPGRHCDHARLLDVSGASYTGPDGKRVILLSDAMCLPQHRLLSEPVNLLATARSEKPCFVTTTHSLINPTDVLQSDLEITVFSWDATGAAAPNVPFHWRCRVHSATVLL